MPCSLVGSNRAEEPAVPNMRVEEQKMEAKDSSKMSAGTKQTIWYHIPKVQKHFSFLKYDISVVFSCIEMETISQIHNTYFLHTTVTCVG